MVTTFGAPPASAAEQLLDRLNEPQTAESLNRILDNLELIAFGVTAVDGFLHRSEAVAESVAAGVTEIKAAAPDSLGNILTLLPRLMDMLPQMTVLVEQVVTLSKMPEFQRLLDVLSNPQTLEAIISIVNNIELIAFLVTAMDGFIQRADTIADNVAASLADVKPADSASSFNALLASLPQLTQSLPSLIDALPQITEAGNRLQPLLQSPEFSALMSSGIFAPKTVAVVGQAGDALVESYDRHRQEPKSLGLFG
ncbi:MAG: DUF1641 domain-containing protein, partial [Anaerolineae bacterium]|nr:DUF1641 domain-containing protein [Anaerolineae bacterium]